MVERPLETVAVIPARGGSKGIPHKNIMDFCGLPLIAWSIRQALAARTIDAVYVSSENEQILCIAKEHGALPILRPAELATDTATSESALLHALDTICQGRAQAPDALVFLQATSPLRTPDDIDGAVGQFFSEQADSLFSGCLLDDFCVWHMKDGKLDSLSYDWRFRGRRQEREPLYLENGSIYVFCPSLLRESGNRLGGRISFFQMAAWQSQEIDSIDDVEIAENIFTLRLRESLTSRMRTGGINARLSPHDLDLIIYDFDGVMTDNCVLVLEDGREAVRANRADGLGIEMIRAAGLRQVLVSTERNPVVAARARKLGLNVIQGCRDKAAAVRRLCESEGLDPKRLAFVGNDVNDLTVMEAVGHTIAPADAHPTVLARVNWVTQSGGGRGVIREIAEQILGLMYRDSDPAMADRGENPEATSR